MGCWLFPAIWRGEEMHTGGQSGDNKTDFTRGKDWAYYPRVQ